MSATKKPAARQSTARKPVAKKSAAKRSTAKALTRPEPATPARGPKNVMKQPIEPRHFATAAAFGAWLDEHHASAQELWVGFWKKGSGKPSIDWPQSVREALRVGWIDGLRRPLSDEAYLIRFTPRRQGSVWSAINIATAEELIAQGRMHANGLRAFEDRHTNAGSGYRIAERKVDTLPAAQEKRLRANKAAWAYWQQQPPGYRRAVVHWVTSAKRKETQASRLEQLIAACAQGRRLGD